MENLVSRGLMTQLFGFTLFLIPKLRALVEARNLAVAGCWFLQKPDWTPPADLIRFLSSGPPPVYVGFGSMSHAASRRRGGLSTILLEAISQFRHDIMF